MAGTEMLTVFCYDVSDNRKRRRVAKILETQAVRVQKSVFEAWMEKRQAMRLAQRAAQVLGRGDSLRVYAVGENGFRRTRVFGAGVLSERQDFFLV